MLLQTPDFKRMNKSSERQKLINERGRLQKELMKYDPGTLALVECFMGFRAGNRPSAESNRFSGISYRYRMKLNRAIQLNRELNQLQEDKNVSHILTLSLIPTRTNSQQYPQT